MGGDRMAKRLSFGSIMRKKLSDITNNPPSCHSLDDDLEDPQPEQEQHLTKCHNDSVVQQLLRERVTLMQVIAQRNKDIQLAAAEVQKLKLQNWHLAQSNTHMLAELNLGRDKIKTLQHEVACNAALLKAKDQLPQMKGEEKVVTLAKANDAEVKNRRHTRKSQSLGPPAPSKTDVKKGNSENRRRSLRRQSARFKSNKKESVEDLFELEDLRLQVTQPDEPVEEEGCAFQMRSTSSEDKPDNKAAAFRNEVPGSSFGRPLRKSVEKIQSFKEPSLRYKMRRVE